MAPTPSRSLLVAGIDLATAEARVAVADRSGHIVVRSAAPLARPHRPEPGASEQDAGSWWPAVARALRAAVIGLEGRVVAVAVSATSGTVVLADRRYEPVGPALLYDDARAPAEGRWDWLLARRGASAVAAHAWHASDLIVNRLTGAPPPTDWSSALKTGHDPATGRWGRAGAASSLRPHVAAPTSSAGNVCDRAAEDTGLPAGCDVRLGMTDGCAAQVAAGADRPGRYVTVLGTTLVIKGGSEHRLDDPLSGVYSHRHPDGWWLPGGASNTGGSSLTTRFRSASMVELDRAAAARGPSGTACYPLSGTGERFPFVAAGAEALWTAPPEDEVDAYRAVLEGVAFVERLAYERLAGLGAAIEGPRRTAGGGGRSRAWSAIRATVLDTAVVRPESADSAFGACILAAAGTLHESLRAATDAMVARTGAEVVPVAVERDRMEESYGRVVAALVERGWLSWRR